MTRIPNALRRIVTERAGGFCEYCRAHQRYIIFMEIDHIQPEAAEGLTVEGNLCLACTGCNDSKHDYQTGIDPLTQQSHPLYNPRTQLWGEHFQWSADFSLIIGKTPVGRATIERLDMNRALMVAVRPDWRKIGWTP
jgi:hypothetical protein